MARCTWAARRFTRDTNGYRMAMSEDSEFIARVAELARIPEDDAGSLVRDFLAALTGMVDRQTWDLIRSLVPGEIGVSWEEGADYEPTTIEQFLLDVSRREPVATERGAEHARAVAEAVREQATESELRQLASAIQDDDLLALFEETRGELTTPQTPTEGMEAIHSPGSSRGASESDQTGD